MEGMHLAKLEAVVEKMLGNLADMRRQNAALQAEVAAKKEQIAGLEARLHELKENQAEVSSRVTTLLSSIEEWEGSLEETGADVDVPDEEGDGGYAEPKGGGLFSLGE